MERPTTMRQKEELVNKVKHLLRKAGMPRFLHHFGPRLYELWQHVLALFVKSYCRLSYRRTTRLLRDLGFSVGTKSTIQRYADKLGLPFWQTALKNTVGRTGSIAAIDGTGLDRSTPSWHYIKRIDGSMPRTGYKLSILATKKKVLSLRIRAKPAHDIRDVKYLLTKAKTKPTTLVMDKAYDAEWLHKYCHKQKIRSIAPLRKGSCRGFHRKKLLHNFPQQLYNKRSRVEATIHALKQKFGANIHSKHIGPARTEMYCRAILHNILLKSLKSWD